MSLISSAAQKAHWEKSAFPVTRVRYNHSVLVAWFIGLPFAVALGAGANYLWHDMHNTPVIHQIEIKQKTPLPYQLLDKEVLYSTTALPVVTPPVTDVADENNSRELQKRVANAAAETDMNTPNVQTDISHTASADNDTAPAITDAQKAQLPSMKYNAHVYASNNAERVINLNGHDYHEGDVVAPGLILKQIAVDSSIFTYQGQDFSVNALTDW